MLDELEKYFLPFVFLIFADSDLRQVWKFCILVYMEEIKSYYGMNLEQNLPFSWAPFKTGRKHGCKSKRTKPFKIERTNSKLENMET